MHVQAKIIIFIVIALALVFIIIGRNSIMKWAVKTAAKSFIGIELEMDSAHLGIINTDIKLTNAVVMSPKGFEEEQMIKAPSIYVNYELMPLFFKKIHFTDLMLDISEIVIIKDPEGKMNTDAVKRIAKRGVTQRDGEGKPESPPPAEKEKVKSIPLEIDYVNINLGKVVFKDYSHGETPQVSTIQLGVSKVQFRNVNWDDVLAAMRFLSSASKANSAQKRLFKNLGSIFKSRDIIGESLKILNEK